MISTFIKWLENNFNHKISSMKPVSVQATFFFFFLVFVGNMERCEILIQPSWKLSS